MVILYLDDAPNCNSGVKLIAVGADRPFPLGFMVKLSNVSAYGAN
jgi:hypothetical protein